MSCRGAGASVDLWNVALGSIGTFSYIHKLLKSTLHPSNVQRCSAKFFFNLFNEVTVNALSYFIQRDRCDWIGTLKFVDKVAKLAKIVNVKTPSIGFRKLDRFRCSITASADWKLEFIESCGQYFERWESSKRPGLSNQTFWAIQLLCKTLPAIARYLITCKGFKYVMLGNLQSDQLESRFGCYRQMCGGNFYLSYRQLCDSEKKIKIVSLLKHSGLTLNQLQTLQDQQQEDTFHCSSLDASETLSKEIDLDAIQLEENETNVLFYVAGYIAYHIGNIHHCKECMQWTENIIDVTPPIVDDCYSTFTCQSLFHIINRGGLKCPTDILFEICILAYKSFCSLKASPNFHTLFLGSKNTRQLFHDIIVNLISQSDYEYLLETTCSFGHSFTKILLIATRSFFNILAKQFITVYNSVTFAQSDKRKIAKLRSSNNKVVN